MTTVPIPCPPVRDALRAALRGAVLPPPAGKPSHALLCAPPGACSARVASCDAYSRTDAASVMAPDAAEAPAEARSVSKHACGFWIWNWN